MLPDFVLLTASMNWNSCTVSMQPFVGRVWGNTDLFIGSVLQVQAWLQEAAKDDTAAFREQVLRAAHSTAQVLAHQLPQDVPEMPLVLVIDEAVVEDTHAFVQPQAHQRLLAVALLLAHHQHALHQWVWSVSLCKTCNQFVQNSNSNDNNDNQDDDNDNKA